MEVLERLIACLAKLPGVGRRSAERMAVRLARNGDLAGVLMNALGEVRESVCCCSRCGSLTGADLNPCRLCTSAGRDGTVLCVVEDPGDIAIMEKSGGFNGRYHALMGRLSPMKGQGRDGMRLKSLLARIDDERFGEVILALSTDVEGDATAAMIADMLKDRPVRVSRLAYGLPAGSGIGYSDPVTLARAINGRVPELPHGDGAGSS
jgi:recombination protein RecR